jgi:hypothetical protein
LIELDAREWALDAGTRWSADWAAKIPKGWGLSLGRMTSRADRDYDRKR